MDELMMPKAKSLLIDSLVSAFVDAVTLRTWLRNHLRPALAQLRGGNLYTELIDLQTWADGEDGMRTLLQRLADHPPGTQIPTIIFALTHGAIRATATTLFGLPLVDAERRWFAANRAFVNRRELREHLRQFGQSEGAHSVLVVNGDRRSGKSFTKSLVAGFQTACLPHTSCDIDDYARRGIELGARELAGIIGRDEKSCPAVDETKEEQAVPILMDWLAERLGVKRRWVIVDHCNRLALAPAARSFLILLVSRLHIGHFKELRLILIDFDRNDLPVDCRQEVRYDRAELPRVTHVAEWCEEIATVARRQCPPATATEWAGDAFAAVEGLSIKDGSWQMGLQRELTKIAQRVMACQEII